MSATRYARAFLQKRLFTLAEPHGKRFRSSVLDPIVECGEVDVFVIWCLWRQRALGRKEVWRLNGPYLAS